MLFLKCSDPASQLLGHTKSRDLCRTLILFFFFLLLLYGQFYHDERIMMCLQLIRELGNINVKKKEPPFCYPYSLKARVLVLTHLARMEVSENIEEGKPHCFTLRLET